MKQIFGDNKCIRYLRENLSEYEQGILSLTESHGTESTVIRGRIYMCLNKDIPLKL
jgi:hypothetical protein